MKQTINEYQFRDAFMRIRPDNFSYAGLTAMFEYFEQYEEDTGEEMELDVIAICCDFGEYTLEEVVSEYIYQIDSSGEPIVFDLPAYNALFGLTKEEQKEYVMEWLQDRTTVIPVDDDRVIVQAF